jgi:hypothetical protein
MLPQPSASFPSSTERLLSPAPRVPGGRRALRLVLAAWAGLVYLAYWLGYLGIR